MLWNLVKGVVTDLTGKHRKQVDLIEEDGREFADLYYHRTERSLRATRWH